MNKPLASKEIPMRRELPHQKLPSTFDILSLAEYTILSSCSIEGMLLQDIVFVEMGCVVRIANIPKPA